MVKPLKRNEHLLQLSKEHHFSLLFCWKIRKGVKKGVEQSRIIDYILYFWNAHLLPHFAEEDILFQDVDDSLVRRAYAEHHQITTVLKSLNWATIGQKSELIREIADLMERHVRFEERELFPHLEQAIPASQLAIIGKKLLEAQPEPLQDNYEDPFWN